MARESWVKKAWQYNPETGASGWFPVLDPETGDPIIEYGNVTVDYVWGNFPLQPDEDRDGNSDSFGGGVGDAYWDSTNLYNSDTLQTVDYSVNVGNQWGGVTVKVPADSHIIATTGYSNYPAYIPNYAGDGDTGLETVVPNFVGVKKSDVGARVTAANLNYSFSDVSPVISYAVADGDTLVLTVDSTYNLRAGDPIYVNNFAVDETPYGLGSVTVVSVTATSITLANAGEWTFDDVATGDVWGVSNDNVRVISQDPVAGAVVDVSTTVELEVLYVD